jgi:N-acyl-D-aspartate/D-glutamate deacylase/CubicO group peptidase (beta-lactamase class C family)
MRRILLLLVLFLVAYAGYTQTRLPLKRLDSILFVMQQQELLNGAVLWAENGKTEYTRAAGVANIQTGEKITTKSAFNLASVSKQFVAMLVMILAQEGKLAYDDPITKLLPEVPYPNITIRNLLNHTGGMVEYFDLAQRYLGPLDTLTNDGMLQLFKTHHPPLEFQPGEKWSYSNTGYVMLGSIVARASGKSFAEYFNEKIAVPLGLKNTYVHHHQMPVPFPTPNRVYGFSRVNGKNEANDLIRIDGVIGDGNVYSSVEDLAKWVNALDEYKLLPRAAMKIAYTPAKLNDGTTYPYGFGWGFEKNGEVIAHTGSWVGFRTIVWRDTVRHVTLIALDNSDNNSGIGLIKAHVNNLLDGKPLTMPVFTLIKNVKVIDGTGTPPRAAAVRIRNEQIWAVGDLQPFPGEQVIDGAGKTLTPGFIDTHSHHDWGMDKNPEITMALAQGITTIVVGQDGGSAPIKEIEAQLKKTPLSLNLATYAGHNSIRVKAMGNAGFRRQATADEVQKMKTLLQEELDGGALGLSSGLEYERGFYSSRDEVIELAKLTAAAGGRYMSHIRSEDISLEDALDEIIGIGREAKLPVQISHFKIAMRSKWGKTPAILAALQEARRGGVNITADWYPYEYWSSTLRVLFPKRDYTNLASAEFAMKELVPPDKAIISRYEANPAYEWKTIAEIAKMRNETPAVTLMHLIAESEAKDTDEDAICGSMTETDMVALMDWPYTNICSDGAAEGHPRGHGAFARVLARYVREQHRLTLENAIYKMTGLAAENVGIAKRGLIAPGYFADLALFDPATVVDNATFQKPLQLSSGFSKIWVNGKVVFSDGKVTKLYPGKLLKR